jgi:uncharacterized membrane protein
VENRLNVECSLQRHACMSFVMDYGRIGLLIALAIPLLAGLGLVVDALRRFVSEVGANRDLHA